MGSRLSSMLVRDGIVGVKRLEKAFRRQVVYGGNLDTVLLEMGMVAEERLCQYLALSSGLPPAARNDLPPNMLAVVATMLPELMAGEHRVVPLGKEGDALRVAVHAPVNMELLEDLADHIDCALQPLIVPEYRWHVWFGQVYGGTPLERFVTLATELDNDAMLQPVGRSQTIIVDDSDDRTSGQEFGNAPQPSLVGSIRGTATSNAALPDNQRGQMLQQANRQSARRITLRGIEPAQVQQESPTLQSMTQRIGGLAESFDSPKDTLRMTPSLVEPAPEEPSRVRRRTSKPPLQRHDSSADSQPASASVLPPLSERQSVPILAYSELPSDSAHVAAHQPTWENSGRTALDAQYASLAPMLSPSPNRMVTSPLVPAEAGVPLAPRLARQLLASAEHRDAVFVTLLRAARYRTRWAGILTVQGGAAIGRIALAEAGIATSEFTTVLIPLEMQSGFHTAAVTKLPYVGPLRSNDTLDMMLRKMGGVVPSTGLVMPVLVKDRVVALMVAHRLERELLLPDVSDVIALDKAVSDSLAAVILRGKSSASTASISERVASASRSEISQTTASTEGVSAATTAASIPTMQVPAMVEPAGAVPLLDPTNHEVMVEPARTMQELLDELSNELPSAAEDAMEEAAQRAAEALPHIDQRFPGRLRINRFAVSGRPLQAAQYGGLLELVVRIGPAATDLLVTKMSAGQRDVRFYATVCAAQLRPRGAINALVERLFDSDLGVRSCAVDALTGYSPRDLDAAMAYARHAVHSSDLDRVTAASKAIADLSDVAGIPDLLTAMAKGSRFAEVARATLILLCRQDFGTSERRWRHWWDDNHKRHRLEWLIDALGHKETTLRQGAIEDLRRMTEEHFGYHYDMSKKDRDLAQSRWQHWWREAGRSRFS